MIEALKSVRPMAYVILLGSILISYVFLKASGMNDLLTMVQTIFGGKPLSSPMLRGYSSCSFFYYSMCVLTILSFILTIRIPYPSDMEARTIGLKLC